MTQIRFWPMKSLPMYGSSVEELHLDIDGEHFVVRVEGEPVLDRVDDAYVATQAGAQLSDDDEIVEPDDEGEYTVWHDRTEEQDGLR